MFHRVHFISAATATIAVLILLLTVLSPSPSLYSVAYAQANSAPTFDDGATTTRNVEETPWYRMTDYRPFMENNNRDAGAPVEATDTDSGDTLTYSLDGEDVDHFKIDESSGQIRTKEPLDYENDPAEYTVTVSVHDGKDSSGGPDETIDATITVTITLTNVNEPPKPTREEGEPQPDYDGDMEFTILENTIGPMVFFLKDPEGRGEGWLISGLASDIDSNLFDYEEDVGPTNEQQILFKEPPDYENPEDANKDNVYTFTIRLYDTYRGENGKVAQTFPNIKVRVTDVEESNENPEFAEEDTSRSIAETAAPGASVGDPVAADDLDNDTLTYTLGGHDAASFDIDASSGQLKTKDALDYETKSSYTITVSVSDGKNLENSADDEIDDTITVTIDVTDVNEPPQFAAEAPVELTVAENTAVDTNIGEPIGATDDDDRDTLIYSLSETDTEIFDIDTSTGQIKTKAELDFETTPSYIVTVLVSDGRANDGTTENSPVPDNSITVIIDVTNVNEPPQFADDAPTEPAVDENTAPDTDIGSAYMATDPESDTPLTYSLGGTDAASFAIDDSTGQLKTKVGLDYETKSSYTVDVQVTDGVDADGNTNTTVDDTHTVTITVTNVDENGSITFSSDPPTFGTALTATVADPDGGVTGETWEWEISDDQSTWNPITGADTNTYTPIAGDLNKYLRATAQYTDAEGSGKTAQKETGTVADATHTNSRPEFAAQEDTRSIAENTAAGQKIGEPVAALDDSVGTLVYSLGGTDAASFDIDTSTGQLETKGDLDHETKDTYTVTVSVTDGLDEYSKADTVEDDDSIEVTINVTDVNEGPTFADDALDTQTVPENTAADTNIGSAYTANDPESDTPLTYSLGGTDAASFAIGETNGQLKTKAALDFETKETYSVTIQVTDGKDADGSTETPATIDDTHAVTITVTDEDDPGTITFSSDPPSAGTALTATLEDDDSIKTAPAVTWVWQKSSTDQQTWTAVTGAGTNSITLDANDVGNYYRATATYDDEKGTGKTATGETTGAVTAAPVTNQNPSFTNATTTRSVAENTSAGQNIGDPVAATHSDSKGILVYALGGTDAASFGLDTVTGQLKSKTVFDYDTDAKTSYTVTVSVKDGMDDYSNADPTVDDSIDVTINVTNVNEPPEFDANAPTALNVVENTAAGENIGTAITAADPDNGDTVTYSLDNGDGAAFDIDSSGQIKTKDPLDRETKSSYSVTVTATDSESATDTHRVTITVTETNDPPAFTDENGHVQTTTTREVAENTAAGQPVGDPVAATDDENDPLTYSLGGTDSASFDIEGETGQIKVKDALDYESGATSYNVTVSVTDGKDTAGNTEQTPTEDASIDVTITVTNVNEGPTFDSSNTATREVAENTPTDTAFGGIFTVTDPESDTPTYSLAGTDVASFDIDTGTGQLKTKADLDHEDKDSYSVTIQVTDGKDADGNAETPATSDASHAVTINVTDVDDLGTIRFLSDPPSAGTTLTATLDDDDGVKSSPAATWKWESSPNGTDTWTVITDETTNRYTPGTDDVGDYLRVTATYEDKFGSGKTASKVSQAVLTAPTTNLNPKFDSNASTTRSVAENTPAGRNIGDPYTASHGDRKGTLVYSLDTADATNFDIDSSTGQLKTKTVFDYENDTLSYTVTVSVRDGMDDYSNADSAVDHTIAVTINVTNVNEPPEFDSNAPTTLNVVENTAAGENIGTVITATDPDNGDTVTYSLDGQDGAAFEIDSSGQIKTKDPLDRETKSSYSVAITATDSESATATHRVTITVTDEEHEPPRFDEEYGDGEASLTREVAENTAAGQPVGDPVAATDAMATR